MMNYSGQCLKKTLENIENHSDRKWPQSVVSNYDRTAKDGYPNLTCPPGLEPSRHDVDDPWNVLVLDPHIGVFVKKSLIVRCYHLEYYYKLFWCFMLWPLMSIIYIFTIAYSLHFGRYVDSIGIVFFSVMTIFLIVLFGVQWIMRGLFFKKVNDIVEYRSVYTLLPSFLTEHIIRRNKAELKKIRFQISANALLNGVISLAAGSFLSLPTSKIAEVGLSKASEMVLEKIAQNDKEPA